MSAPETPWQHIDMADIRIGDYIRGTTATHAQKWMFRTGYEDYNATKEGVVVACGNRKYPCEIQVRTVNGVCSACLDPGTSGWYYFEKYARQTRPHVPMSSSYDPQ